LFWSNDNLKKKKVKYNTNINPTLTVQNYDIAPISINQNPFLKSSSETLNTNQLETIIMHKDFNNINKTR